MRVGAIASSDTFYDPDAERHERWSSRGVLAVEMEAAVLFTLGALRRVQAGCLLTVSDIVIGGEFTRISDEELRAAVDRMTRVALATVTGAISETVFLVNPAAEQRRDRDGAGPRSRTGAAELGLQGDALLSERPGPADRARAARPRRRRVAARRRRRRRDGERGRERDRRRSTSSWRSSRAGPAGTSSAPTASRTSSRPRSRSRCTGARARSTSAGRATVGWDGAEGESLFANIAQRRHERRDRQARERDARRRSAARSRTRGRRSPSSRAGATARSRFASAARSTAAGCTT